jgi:hypothetical protein
MTYQELSENIKAKKYETLNGKTERDFFDDLVELFELDPKDRLTQRMYSKAWENGHSGGYFEVYNHFHDLIEVFKGE